MTLAQFFAAAEVFFIAYMALMSGGYLLLNLLSVSALNRYMHRVRPDAGFAAFDLVAPPVSILVPAFNEEQSIVTSVRSLLQLTYPEYEIIVVNDGSRDSSLDVLIDAFELEPSELPHRDTLDTGAVRASYASRQFPNLRVLDKDNGGKSDSLNAALNAARFPYVCCVDADSVLQRDSLQRVMRAFLDDARTVAAGGTIRVANGCDLQGGFLERVNLPRSVLAMFQIVEYLRAFQFGRLGWDPLNALLIISGAFGVFRRDALLEIGGFRTDTVGEDMDLVMRLHRHYGASGEPYNVAFVPDPICWTEVPERVRVLHRQRARWQRGLAECLLRHRGLAFARRSGAAGWLAYPFLLVFEMLSPVVEVFGYLSMSLAWAYGLVSTDAFLAFMLLAVGLGILLSMSALLLEEASFHLYARARQLGTLMCMAVLENFGYRQMVSVMRFWGLLQWVFGRRGGWGEMTRAGRLS